ncbi:conserved exported hypothetical protein [Candidatus Accumulibacter aalborgensis]|uniref:DnrO protein n=1 Tax=Candidatus Accumulibacter aalborgensis TaxID=1860102 RepID=A0A1A8XDD3_9PROT|nr:hypothetical protein [Candidatus Accumulibacter aalborgensis]SBT03219.1 conserved exported hypothetical protein [Candidatus Accumulibacter aalborgensis]
MNIHRTLLAALLSTFATVGPAFAVDSHQHAAAAPTKLMLDHGKKWATDEPLRRNMSEIRSALAAKATAIHHGTLTADDYQALGSLVEAHSVKIVTECKLGPAADENLHHIVAELSTGADAMQGKSKATPAAGAAQTIGAVNQYGRYFQHPGWQPID